MTSTEAKVIWAKRQLAQAEADLEFWIVKLEEEQR